MPYITIRWKFIITVAVSTVWMLLSIWLSIPWFEQLSEHTTPAIAAFLIGFIAIIPGFMNAFIMVALALDKRPRVPLHAHYPSVTVLVAAYNEAESIEDTVRSLMRQTYPGALHVTVINDGSTDNTAGIVRDEGAKLDFARDMSYGDYLQLDRILDAQTPLSPDHNEMLFIVQHQTSELWMKLMLHELQAAVAHVASDRLPEAFKMLARVSRIMEQLVHAWDVLATMTPPEYSAIRPYLAKSSGFQSWQYRCIEFTLGNKNAAMLKPHAHRADLLARPVRVPATGRVEVAEQLVGAVDQVNVQKALP